MLEDINYPGLLETGGNAEGKCRGKMQSEKVGVRRAAPHLEQQYRRKDTLEDASTRLANQTTVLKGLAQPNTDRREIRI